MHDLGEQPIFTDNLDELARALEAKGGSKTALLDNSAAHAPTDIKSLKAKYSDLKLVGFESFHPGQTPASPAYAELLDISILLPDHVERAKTRLRTALRQFKPSGAPTRTGLTRPPIAFKRPASRIAAKVASYKKPTT
ncbi:MAG: hypothetical protein HRT56_04180, partial [Coraliomargarita sp.]|nr:hypothetical protein [Coraliomargarita sp.]